MLKKLFKYQERLQQSHNIEYKRYLYKTLDFENKMIGIFGARGVGKTTILFQYLAQLQDENKKALYISLDYPFFTGVDIIEIVEQFIQEGGEYLLLDEVHRYADFSAYLKTLYDLFDIHIIFTGSSATSILNAQSDLSRRVTLYKLHGFSFREYLELKFNTTLLVSTIEDITSSHISIAKSLLNDIPNLSILDEFQNYLKHGYYPFYFDKQNSYYENLLNTINLTIDIDLTSLGLIEQKYTYKLKRLLEVICESKPFEVNFTKISQISEISRTKLYDYITYLNDGEMLLLVDENIKGIKKINKPAKIYLNNTNLLFAYCENAERGTIRETFFANQTSLNYTLKIGKDGDFIINNKYIFEIGGKNKKFTQIKDLEESYVVSDNIEIGSRNKIPLYLFGLNY